MINFLSVLGKSVSIFIGIILYIFIWFTVIHFLSTRDEYDYSPGYMGLSIIWMGVHLFLFITWLIWSWIG